MKHIALTPDDRDSVSIQCLLYCTQCTVLISLQHALTPDDRKAVSIHVSFNVQYVSLQHIQYNHAMAPDDWNAVSMQCLL